MKISIVGKERSGTNWLASLIRVNYEYDRLIEEGKHRTTLEHLNDGFSVIVTSKHPLVWYHSMFKFMGKVGVNFSQFRDQVRKDHHQEMIFSWWVFHLKYLSWQQSGRSIFFVKYDDVLADPEGTISGLGLGLIRKPGAFDVIENTVSRHGRDAGKRFDHSFYVNKGWKQKYDEVPGLDVLLESIVEWEAIEGLGYSPEALTETGS